MKKIGLILFAGWLAAWGARPPFSSEDAWQWRSVTEPRIAPDGEHVVFVEAWNDRAHDRQYANLLIVSSDGKTRRRLTQGDWRDTSPAWSADGARVAWISDRTGSPQIWTAGMDGAATQVTRVERPPLSLAWSPDGQSIAFTALVPVKSAPAAWAPPALLPLLRQGREGYIHLFLAGVAGGVARQVSSGNFDHTAEAAWMPDGRSILLSRDGEIYSVRVADGTAKQLTSEGGHNDHAVTSPDGSRIAWLGTGGKSQSYAVRKVFVMNPDGSRLKALSGALDRDAGELQWSSDSRTVYFVADDRGSTHVYAARNDGTVRQATRAAERLWGFSLADNGRAVAVRSTPTEGDALVTFTVDRVSEARVLHSPNEHLLAEREIAAAEEIAYPSGANTVQGWVVKPPGFDRAKKYPLLLDIRDSREMYGVDFNLRAQIFAARGFVVLCVNPRGTPGYGEVFGNLLPTRNPGDDVDDLLAGVDFAVGRGYGDAQRVTVAGGALAAWAIGHSDRFRAAVVVHPAAAWGAKFWGDGQGLKTATLVLAGDPDPASEALYAALQARKVESALARIATPQTPGRQILELESIQGWLAR